MENKIVKSVLSVIGLAILALLLFAFVKSEINPFRWGIISRFVMTILWVTASVVSIGIINEKN